MKRSLAIEIYSAGVDDFRGEPPLIETTRTCLHYETPVPKHSPTFVKELPLDTINRFLVMEHRHAIALQNQFGISADRISLLGNFDPQHRGPEIDDPFFSYREEVYRRSYRMIRDCVVGYLETEDHLR
jgi:protein-tyrosine-phosphatase